MPKLDSKAKWYVVEYAIPLDTFGLSAAILFVYVARVWDESGNPENTFGCSNMGLAIKIASQSYVEQDV